MNISDRFTDQVLRSFERPQQPLYASAPMTKELRESGHPQFADLELGEQRSAQIASVFLDLSKFTWRSFWEEPEESARLAHAVMTGFALVVNELGGHVLGLRGDGMYAAFGPTRVDAVSAAVAGLAAAVALNAVETGLNPQLRARGIDPVVARAGIDFGRLAFIRSGTANQNEVNVIGFSANFAAKCEKIADGWEVVAGQGFASTMPTQDLLSHRGVKSFTKDYEKKYYHYYDLQWRPLLAELGGIPEELAGRPLEDAGY